MRRRTFITLLAVGPVAACARPAQATMHGLTMGTSYTVELAAVNRSMSTYDPGSELSAFNRREDLLWGAASPGLLEVLDSASRISAATQGAFDVTVGPIVKAWRSARRSHTFPSDDRLARARAPVARMTFVALSVATGFPSFAMSILPLPASFATPS